MTDRTPEEEAFAPLPHRRGSADLLQDYVDPSGVNRLSVSKESESFLLVILFVECIFQLMYFN